MANGFRGGKTPTPNYDDDRVEFTKLLFRMPPHTIEITEQINGVEYAQTIAISKISTFTTWESDGKYGYEHKRTYWLNIELVSGKEYKFSTYDKNKFDEWVRTLKDGVR